MTMILAYIGSWHDRYLKGHLAEKLINQQSLYPMMVRAVAPDPSDVQLDSYHKMMIIQGSCDQGSCSELPCMIKYDLLWVGSLVLFQMVDVDHHGLDPERLMQDCLYRSWMIEGVQLKLYLMPWQRSWSVLFDNLEV